MVFRSLSFNSIGACERMNLGGREKQLEELR